MEHTENDGPRFRFLIDMEVEVVDVDLLKAAQLQEQVDQDDVEGIAPIDEPNELSVPRVVNQVIDYAALSRLGLKLRGASILPRPIGDDGNWAGMRLVGYHSGPKTRDE
ncbi:hypothetical protein [Herbiconiux daphne]|uniref:Uncharacterized protein n=1 Tax=Herbiconiux daphne TaxID=2970914 RepID=A0ABT2GZA2_9MICO|nr:hypothetical protein [Herbiconiux daphne]MCS5732385.1 hypothetical protein [Herbiconiux daphne]